LLVLGAGSARAGGVSPETEMLGIEGIGSLIAGTDEISIDGTIEEIEASMVETVGASSMRNVGGSGTLIVGTIGAEIEDFGS